MSKIAIFPASGKLASSVYTHLIKIIDPSKLILISRHPDRIPSEYTASGVTTRKADYNAPKSLEHVIDDVSCLLLLSYPSIEFEHRFEVDRNFLPIISLGFQSLNTYPRMDAKLTNLPIKRSTNQPSTLPSKAHPASLIFSTPPSPSEEIVPRIPTHMSCEHTWPQKSISPI